MSYHDLIIVTGEEPWAESAGPGLSCKKKKTTWPLIKLFKNPAASHKPICARIDAQCGFEATLS